MNDHILDDDGREDAIDHLADSLLDHAPTPPGTYAASPISLEVAGNFARFLESMLAEQLGPVALKLIESRHDDVARFFSPQLADLIAKGVAEFGTSHS